MKQNLKEYVWHEIKVEGSILKFRLAICCFQRNNQSDHSLSVISSHRFRKCALEAGFCSPYFRTLGKCLQMSPNGFHYVNLYFILFLLGTTNMNTVLNNTHFKKRLLDKTIKYVFFKSIWVIFVRQLW